MEHWTNNSLIQFPPEQSAAAAHTSILAQSGRPPQPALAPLLPLRPSLSRAPPSRGPPASISHQVTDDLPCHAQRRHTPYQRRRRGQAARAAAGQLQQQRARRRRGQAVRAAVAQRPSSGTEAGGVRGRVTTKAAIFFFPFSSFFLAL
jgi:hypothetical protein